MTHLTTHISGDIISPNHLNDIKSMIDDAVYDIDTYAIKVNHLTLINNSGHVLPVRITARDSNGIVFYASDGVTQIALLDENGNFFIKGNLGML